jgi:hypothetical protein
MPLKAVGEVKHTYDIASFWGLIMNETYDTASVRVTFSIGL